MRAIICVAILFVAACGRDASDIDDLVGARCTSDRQCEDRCFIDGDKFPGGFCSLTCVNDQDCPDGTYCVDENGGVCLYGCPAFDCNELGPDWVCRDRSRFGGGNVDVCFGE